MLVQPVYAPPHSVALENLVSSLQNKIARLTDDIESHRSTIEELREEIERDAVTIEAKNQEVEALRDQIERLEMDVDRIRGVVEETLRERRLSRDPGSAMGELSAVMEEDDQEDEDQDQQEHLAQPSMPNFQRGVYPPPTQDQEYDTETELDDNEQVEDTYQQQNTAGQPQIAVHEATIEYTQRSIEPPETRRMPSQLPLQVQQHEMRPRSGSMASTARASSRMSSRAPTPRFGPSLVPDRPQSRLSMRTDAHGQDDEVTSMSSLGRPLSRGSRNFAPEGGSIAQQGVYADPDVSLANSDPGSAAHAHHNPAPRTNLRAAKLSRHHSSPPSAVAGSSNGLPIPRIRGERAEKLFFAPSQHDERTCRKCRGRRKGKGKATEEEYEEEDTVVWLQTFLARKRERALGAGSLPPQTMLAHLARELEDEFTHYKS